MPIFACNIPLVSLIFLNKYFVFSILLFSSIALHRLLKKAFLSLLAILWNSSFRCLYLSFAPLLFAFLLFTAICKAWGGREEPPHVCGQGRWPEELHHASMPVARGGGRENQAHAQGVVAAQTQEGL